MHMVRVLLDGKETESEDWERNLKATESRVRSATGGILSPMIFTIYGAGLKEWVEHSSIFDCSKENDKKKHKGVKKFDKKRQVQ